MDLERDQRQRDEEETQRTQGQALAARFAWGDGRSVADLDHRDLHRRDLRLDQVGLQLVLDDGAGAGRGTAFIVIGDRLVDFCIAYALESRPRSSSPIDALHRSRWPASGSDSEPIGAAGD